MSPGKRASWKSKLARPGSPEFERMPAVSVRYSQPRVGITFLATHVALVFSTSKQFLEKRRSYNFVIDDE
jgi:hypothetical protein